MRRRMAATSLGNGKEARETVPRRPTVLSTVRVGRSSEVDAKVKRLSEILKNKVITNSLALINNSPKVNGSALLLRVYHFLTLDTRGMLCVSNRRSLGRVGVETSEVKDFGSGLLLLYRAGLSRVRSAVHGRLPRMMVVSSVRAVCERGVSTTPNDISRMERSAKALLRLTGKLKMSVFVMKRMAGRNAITKPEMLRRVISAMLCFRKSERTSCEVLHKMGGHFNSAGRVNIFRVKRRNLQRIRGPSRCVLDNEPTNTDNYIMTYSLRNAEPLVIRVRTLIYRDDFKVPEERTAKASLGEVGLLVTILRGHVKIRMDDYSTCIGVTNNVGVRRPTISLKAIVTVMDDFGGQPVSRGLITFKRMNVDKRIHTIDVTRRHIRRTGGLKFSAYMLPGDYTSDLVSGGKVEVVNMAGVRRTVRLVR